MCEKEKTDGEKLISDETFDKEWLDFERRFSWVLTKEELAVVKRNRYNKRKEGKTNGLD